MNVKSQFSIKDLEHLSGVKGIPLEYGRSAIAFWNRREQARTLEPILLKISKDYSILHSYTTTA